MNITDLLESSMCLTTRMELTGWYYRDEKVNKSRHLNSFNVFNTDIKSFLMFNASWELIVLASLNTPCRLFFTPFI